LAIITPADSSNRILLSMVFMLGNEMKHLNRNIKNSVIVTTTSAAGEEEEGRGGED
jgi:hypothetical protein